MMVVVELHIVDAIPTSTDAGPDLRLCACEVFLFSTGANIPFAQMVQVTSCTPCIICHRSKHSHGKVRANYTLWKTVLSASVSCKLAIHMMID